MSNSQKALPDNIISDDEIRNEPYRDHPRTVSYVLRNHSMLSDHKDHEKHKGYDYSI